MLCSSHEGYPIGTVTASQRDCVCVRVRVCVVRTQMLEPHEMKADVSSVVAKLLVLELKYF